MKTLLLMRHAKSSWKDTSIADHERPLTDRGLADAPRMGQVLCDRELVPQRILCSSALRARQTAEAVIKTSGFQGEVIYLDRLYMAEAEEYIAALRELPDALERVMVIGHNPGLETVLQMLSGHIESLPTAVIAHLVLPVNRWTELSPGADGELVEIWKPKDLFEGIEEETREKDKTRGQKKDKEKLMKKGK